MEAVANDFTYDEDGTPTGGTSKAWGMIIRWQTGPDRKRDGAMVNEVIQACIARLEALQDSRFKCAEHGLALVHLDIVKEQMLALARKAGVKSTA